MLKIKSFGWRNKNLDQISRIEVGFLENGCILVNDDNTEVDFIYCHDSSCYDLAINYHNICKSKGWRTRLLMKVLDLPIHLKTAFSIEKQKLANADLILANSNFVKRQIKEILGYDSYVVYDAIKDVKHIPYIPKIDNYMLMVGRVADRNKRAYLAKELLDLRKNPLDKLIGCGSEIFPFEDENIHNLGILEDSGLETVYNNSKFVLCLGHVEGLNLPLYEANLVAIPIVCSDMTAIEDFPLKEFVCEPNAASINDKINQISADYKKYRDIALDYGESVVRYKFGKKQIAQNIVNAYFSCLKNATSTN